MTTLKGKKGLSAVIATVILVALTMAVIGIIWAVISNLVETGTGDAESCFGVFDKVSIEKRYTCYDSVNQEVEFSINVGDIDVAEVIVGISTNSSGKSFSILRSGSTITNLKMFSGSTNISLPGKNSGDTYVFDIGAAGLSGAPSLIQIIPVVDGVQCEITDTAQGIGAC